MWCSFERDQSAKPAFAETLDQRGETRGGVDGFDARIGHSGSLGNLGDVMIAS
jgi:hypothetical protein